MSEIKIDPASLSDDAKTLCAAWWSVILKNAVIFNSPKKITARGRAALDELVAAGILEMTKRNHYKDSPIEYRPIGTAAKEIGQPIARRWLESGGATEAERWPVTLP